jgi:hypothetical protein
MGWIVPSLLGLHLAIVCLAAQPIEILFDFKTPPETAVVSVMKSEIREILQPARLNLQFQRLGDAESLQSFRKIVLVRFQGACHADWSVSPIQLDQPALLDYPALGRTEVSEGRVLPFVYIFCNEVRAFVPSVSRISQQQMYGRALGRVVVHELYHALLSTLEHTHDGIARSVQSSRDLTGDKLTLDAVSIEKLRKMWGAKENEAGGQLRAGR